MDAESVGSLRSWSRCEPHTPALESWHWQLSHFVKNWQLVDSKSFAATCKRCENTVQSCFKSALLMLSAALAFRYYGNWTFEEAYRRTGREVSITISPATATRLGQPTLINHITAPRVLIASAVATSCSLPGIMQASR